MLATQIEALRMIGEGLSGEVPFIATVFSVLGQARHLAGEKALAHMRSHPGRFLQGLEAITESTLRFLDAARTTGLDGIYYAVSDARYPAMSRDEFITFGRPYDLRILESVGDLWFNVLHLHGTDVAFDWAAGYPAPVINWHDRDTAVSLADGLRQIRGAASGGVSQWSIHQESPEQTLIEARDALAQTGGRRLVLGTGCVIMATTPTRNIRALRESVDNAR
jgi:uroporphyrinogen decarboxylase